MLNNEVCLVLHFGGGLILEQGNPIYNGGDCKMVFVAYNLSYSSLIEKILQVTNWKLHDEHLLVQYLYYTGRFSTLVGIRSDDDLKPMFKAYKNETDSLLMYVRRNSHDAGKSRRQYGDRTVFTTNVHPPNLS